MESSLKTIFPFVKKKKEGWVLNVPVSYNKIILVSFSIFKYFFFTTGDVKENGTDNSTQNAVTLN